MNYCKPVIFWLINNSDGQFVLEQGHTSSSQSGLPDGFFSNKKSKFFSKFWRALDGKMCSFGTFFRFWYYVPRKIWQPCSQFTPTELIFSSWTFNFVFPA
jgi:hypothetical protein